MHNTKNIRWRIGLCFLMAAALIITGCIYPTDREAYAVGYILHDIDANTPTTLAVSDENYGEYQFVRNIPGGTPETYETMWYYTAPGQWIAGSSIYPVGGGITQKVYAYAQNPAESNYRDNFSLYTASSLSYEKGNSGLEQWIYSIGQDEILSYDAFRAIVPRQGEKKEFTFGGPYIPGSVINSYGQIRVRGELLQGINTWSVKSTNYSFCGEYDDKNRCVQRVTREFEKPRADIYRDGVLIEKVNLTLDGNSYYTNIPWAPSRLYYYVDPAPSAYTVVMTIPSYYPLFNHSIITADFVSDRWDASPPWLSALSVPSSFTSGESVPIKFMVRDENNISGVSLEMRTDEGEWNDVEIEVTQQSATNASSVNASAEITVTGMRLDLRIGITDNSGNSQIYELTPVSLARGALIFDVFSDKQTISPGTRVRFYGKVRDAESTKGAGNLFMEVLYNGRLAQKVVTQGRGYRGYRNSDNEWIEYYYDGGNFSFIFDVPSDYTPEMNLSLVTAAVGIYPRQEHIISGFGQVFQQDVALISLDVPQFIYRGENTTLNATLANVGGVSADARLTLYYQEVSPYGDFYGDRQEIKTIDYSLAPHETRAVNITLPSLNLSSQGTIGSYVRIVASLTTEGDENTENDERISGVTHLITPSDASVRVDTDGEFMIGEQKRVSLRIINVGFTELRDVAYTLELINQSQNSNTGSTGGSGGGGPPSTPTPTPGTFNAGGGGSSSGNASEGTGNPSEGSEHSIKPSTLLLSGTIESLARGGEERVATGLTLDTEGQYSLRAKINSAADGNPSNDEQEMWVRAVHSGAELSEYMQGELGHTLVVGRENNITLHISNNGNERTQNASYAISIAEGYCSNSCNSLSLIESGNLSLNRGASLTKQITFTPEHTGEWTFVIALNTSNERRQGMQKSYEHFTARQPGPDFSPWLSIEWQPWNNFLVNEQITFQLNIDNRGTETGNGNYTLTAMSGCSEAEECSEIQIIDEGEATIDSGRGITKQLNYTPSVPGQLKFLLVTNATGDSYTADDYYTRSWAVVPLGANLMPFVDSSLDRMGVGIPREINISVINWGREAAQDGAAEVYGFPLSDCQEDINECLSEENLLFRQEIAVNAGETEDIQFTYTPVQRGSMRFIVVVNASNEIDERNNRYSDITNVRPEGHDIHAVVWTDGNMIIGIPVNVTMYLWNDGIENAIVNYTLFASEGYCFLDDEENACGTLTQLYNAVSTVEDAHSARIEYVPSVSGWVTFILVVNSTGDMDIENNVVYTHLFAQRPGADMRTWISDSFSGRAAVGQDVSFNISIYNSGNQAAEEGKVDAYAFYDDECETTEECITPENKIISQTVALAAGEAMKLPAVVNPLREGNMIIIIAVNASNEIDEGNNRYTNQLWVRRPGADVRAWLDLSDWQLTLNTPVNITLTLFNQGYDIAQNVDYRVSLVPRSCDEECTGTRQIMSGTLLTLEETERITETFTPMDIGEFRLIVSVNASNEIDEGNNEYESYVSVKPQGADLFSWISAGRAHVGEPFNLSVLVINRGSDPATQGTLRVYAWYSDECEDEAELCAFSRAPIATRILSGEPYENYQIQFAPARNGTLIIVTMVNASNEIDEGNNFNYDRLEVYNQGPNLDAWFSINENGPHNEFAVRGEPLNVSLEVQNYGTSRANNGIAYIYARERQTRGFWDYSAYIEGDEDYTLIGSYPIPDVEPGQETQISFIYTPQVQGAVKLMARIALPGDSAANRVYIYRPILNNVPDIAIQDLGSKTLIAGEESEIFVSLLNVGSEKMEDVNVSLYRDREIIGSEIITIPAGNQLWRREVSVPFQATFASPGQETLRATVEVVDDAVTNNNEMTRVMPVYVQTPMNITVYDLLNMSLLRFIGTNKENEEPFTDNIYRRGLTFYDDGLGSPYLESGIAPFETTADSNKIEPMNADVRFAGIALAPSSELSSAFIPEIVQNGTRYVSVFANRLSVPSARSSALVSIPARDMHRFGINGRYMDDYGLYACTTFNFAEHRCVDAWQLVENASRYSYHGSLKIGVEELSPPAEAFALSVSPAFTGATTNLTIVTGERIANLTIEKGIHGRITFRRDVSVSRLRAQQELLQENVEIGYHRISINTSAVPELENVPAELTIRNVDFRAPRILRNGAVCVAPACTMISYNTSEQTVTFIASGFSTFEVVEGQYCGDGMCQASTGEACDACVADCGGCPAAQQQEEIPRILPHADGSISCLSQWSCSWSACVRGTRTQTCIDTKHCSIPIGKPRDKTEPCVAPACTDNDGDGYGVGNGCRGIDFNDNDPAITFRPLALAEPEFPFNASSLPQKNKFDIKIIAISVLAVFIIAGVIASYIVSRKRMQMRASA